MKNLSVTIPRKYDVPSLPTRVIDVEGNNQTPYLRIRQPWNPRDKYERDPDCAHYLILSYCWGRSNEAAKTTKANLQERMKKLDVSSFPRTIRDAIRLTKALGERYLWVDAVCIVQKPSDGDNSDWMAEAPRMSDYYGNALCTIAATGAADSADGCFHERTAQRFPVTSCTLSPWVTTVKKETMYIHPSTPLWWNAVINSPLYQRGWAIQERALSPRIVHWTAHALYLECQGMRASEYRLDGLAAAESITVHENLQKEVHMNIGSMMKYSRREILCWAWYRLIERYCWAHFTYTSDKLVALSGIARRANTYHSDRYVAGLWSENLVEGLAWHTRYYKTRGPRRPTIYIAPSWSWASVDAIVKFVVLVIYTWEWLATVVEVIVVPMPSNSQARSASSSPRREYQRNGSSRRRRDSFDDNTYSSISGSVLHIKGIVQDLRFKIEPKSSDPACLFYASPTAITTRFGATSSEEVFLDAPWEEGQLSLRTFRCLLLGRQQNSTDKNECGEWPVIVGYLILKKTGQEPEQYCRVGWAKVLEWDYNRLLRKTERQTVQIV